MTPMTLTIDARRCSGCQLCVAIYPKAFRLAGYGGADRRVTTSEHDVTSRLGQAVCTVVARSCPERAISVRTACSMPERRDTRREMIVAYA